MSFPHISMSCNSTLHFRLSDQIFPPRLVLSVCTECSDQPVIIGLKATILSSEEHTFTDCISYSISYSLLYPRLNQICNSDRKSVICYEFCITLTKYQHALLNSL